MRHEEREREDNSEPIFGTEAPIVSPYPRKDGIQPGISVKWKIAVDLVLISIGVALVPIKGAQRVGGPGYTPESVSMVILLLLIAVITAQGARRGAILPQQAMGMTFAGFLLATGFLGRKLLGPYIDGGSYAPIYIIQGAVFLLIPSILCSVAFRSRGNSADIGTYEAIRRSASGTPVLVALTIITSPLISDEKQSLHPQSIGVPFWFFVAIWSVLVPLKSRPLISFLAFQVLSFLALFHVAGRQSPDASGGILIGLTGAFTVFTLTSVWAFLDRRISRP